MPKNLHNQTNSKPRSPSQSRKKLHLAENRLTIAIDEEPEEPATRSRVIEQVRGIARSTARKKVEAVQMRKENALNSFEFDHSLPKQLIPRVLLLLPHEEFVRLEIIRSSQPLSRITTNYLVSARGVVGSLRRPSEPSDGTVFIGKAMIDEKCNLLNDVILTWDSMISRRHCKLVLSDWFKAKGIRPDFLSLLIINSRMRHYLPLNVLWIIKQYLYDARKMQITDLGSLSGTFLRVRPGSRLPVHKSMSFLLSKRISLEIMNVFNELNEFLLSFRNRGVLRDIFSCSASSEDIYSAFIQEAFKNYTCNLNTKNLALIFSCSKQPCLQIRISRTEKPDKTTIICDLLLVRRPEQKRFTVSFGNSSHCEFRLGFPTMEFELGFNDSSRRWEIEDVSGVQLEFGLWSCVSDWKDKNRFVPQMREIFNGDEIKISDTVIKVFCSK